MQIALHIAQVVLVVMAVALGIRYFICKDLGCLILSAVCLLGSGLSFWLQSMWPLLAAAALAVCVARLLSCSKSGE